MKYKFTIEEHLNDFMLGFSLSAVDRLYQISISVAFWSTILKLQFGEK